MKQTELKLKDSDRRALQTFRSKGVHLAREVNRAHVLMALDSGVTEATICQVLGLGRTALWRTRAAYRQGGLEYALHDEPRSGQPRKYQTDQEAEVVALYGRRWLIETDLRSLKQTVHLSRVCAHSVDMMEKELLVV